MSWTDRLILERVRQSSESEDGFETGESNTGHLPLLPPSLFPFASAFNSRLLLFFTSVWMKWHGLPASPQVLIFVLFIVPMWSSKMFRCYNDQELQAAADRKLRTHYLRPTEAPRTTARSSSYSCPLELYKTPLSDEQRDRSLSPWRFV